jgi:UPF0755 protein
MAYYHSKYARIKPKKKSRWGRVILWILLIAILFAGAAGYYLYKVIYTPNTWTPNEEPVSIYIPTGSTFNDLKKILYKNGLVIHRNNFEWLAQKKQLDNLVKPGRYIIKNGMTNLDLVNLLRSGHQTPVNVIFNNVRDIYQLAGKVGRQIEADSAEIINLLTDSTYLSKMGLTPLTASTIFIPNTYEFWWNTNADSFIKRMYDEYNKFWNEERKKKATEMGMTQSEIITLASIVEKETNKNDEKPRIAGVYVNRLKKGWRLQADPTLIYAIGDYSIKRVLNKHKTIESPYNTYLHIGLPPGPICIPSISSIDAVLNYDKSNYLYFCAKDDFSGYHVFAKTNRQHVLNAKKYQKALDKLKIIK